MKHRWIIITGMLILLLLPFTQVQGQDNFDDDEDRDLISALVFMVANDTTTNGSLQPDELYAIRDYVAGYYDLNLLYTKQADPEGTGKWDYLTQFWKSEKENDLKKIEAKLDVAVRAYWTKTRPWIDFLQDFFKAQTDPNTHRAPDSRLTNTIVCGAGAANPSVSSSCTQDPENNQALLTSFNSSIQQDSHARVFTSGLIAKDLVQMPESASLLADTAGTGFLISSTSSLTATTTTSSRIPEDSGSSAPLSPSTKPVRFENRGSIPVTVKVGDYSGAEAGLPGGSTAVFPESSSSAILELPPGEYQFCYEWETGEDADGDGYADQRHANSGSYMLGENSADDLQNALLVSLDPDSANSSGGKCGEVDNIDPSLEQAFQGNHQYWVSVVENGCAGFEVETYPKSLEKNLTFNENFSQVTYGPRTYSLAAPHQYRFQRDDGSLVALFFTETGFELKDHQTGVEPGIGEACITYTFLLEDK